MIHLKRLLIGFGVILGIFNLLGILVFLAVKHPVWMFGLMVLALLLRGAYSIGESFIRDIRP